MAIFTNFGQEILRKYISHSEVEESISFLCILMKLCFFFIYLREREICSPIYLYIHQLLIYVS